MALKFPGCFTADKVYTKQLASENAERTKKETQMLNLYNKKPILSLGSLCSPWNSGVMHWKQTKKTKNRAGWGGEESRMPVVHAKIKLLFPLWACPRCLQTYTGIRGRHNFPLVNQDCHATITPMGNLQMGDSSLLSSQSSQLVIFGDYFPTLVTCLAPSSTMDASQ